MFLGIACFFDYKKGRIPNKLIVLGAVTAVVCILTDAFLQSSIEPVANSRMILFWGLVAKNMIAALARLISVTAVLYLLFMLGTLGAGDVKLCAVAVLYLDFKQSILFLAAGFLVAGAVSLGKLLCYGHLRERAEYFFSYVAEIMRTGKVRLYFRKELSMVEKSAVVHMAGPMLAGLVICWWFG